MVGALAVLRVLVFVLIVVLVFVFAAFQFHGFEDFAVPFVFGDFVPRGEGAVGGVEGDVVDDVGGVMPGGGGEIAAGDLERVEQEAGSARVEGVAGEPIHDLPDGVLDG